MEKTKDEANIPKPRNITSEELEEVYQQVHERDKRRSVHSGRPHDQRSGDYEKNSDRNYQSK